MRDIRGTGARILASGGKAQRFARLRPGDPYPMGGHHWRVTSTEWTDHGDGTPPQVEIRLALDMVIGVRQACRDHVTGVAACRARCVAAHVSRSAARRQAAANTTSGARR